MTIKSNPFNARRISIVSMLFALVMYFLHWRDFWYIAGLGAAAAPLAHIESQNLNGDNGR